MQIIWSDDARIDFFENINFLLNTWSAQSASEFIKKVNSVVEILKKEPELYPLTDYKNIRRAVIRKQITLFYKVEEDKIYIVRLWNTLQNPESLNL